MNREVKLRTILRTLRIGVWNARMAFGRKHDALKQLQPDLAIVPECGDAINVSKERFAWVGSLPSKGLAAIAYGDYRVSIDETYDKSIKEVAPVWVTGPNSFFLLALWSQPPYGEAIQEALIKYRPLLTSGPAVVAGDFNHNVAFDKGKRANNHGRTVEMLDELGLASAYHHFNGVAHGKESETTLFWMGKPSERLFHIDYCFLPKTWLDRISSVTIGSHSQWSRHSDHMPLLVDVEPS